MAISFNRTRAFATFKKRPIFLGALDTNHAVTAWTLLDYMADTKITQEVTEKEFTDDSGAVIGRDEVVKSVKIEASWLCTDEKIRQLFAGTGTQSVAGTKFALCMLDAQYDGKQGYWVFYEIKIHRAFEMNLGGEDRGLKFMATAFPNTTCASATVTLPSGVTCWNMSTVTSAAIPADEWFYTADAVFQ